MEFTNIQFNRFESNHNEIQVLDLVQLAQRQNLPHDPQLPHRVRFFLMIYIESGTGYHMVDFKQYPYTPGSVLLIQRDQIHAFDFSSILIGKVVLFTQHFLDHLHTNMRLPNFTPTHLIDGHSPVVLMPADALIRFKRLLTEILTELNQHSPDGLMTMHLFSALTILVYRERLDLLQGPLSQIQTARLGQFYDILQGNYKKIRDANWYAQQVNTTYKTLNQTCKLSTGLTAKQMIDAYTIIEIKRRLVLSDINVQQIAYEFGFEDTSNFIRFFKKETEQTPSQFKKTKSYRRPNIE